jgi:hypothetical protein
MGGAKAMKTELIAAALYHGLKRYGYETEPLPFKDLPHDMTDMLTEWAESIPQEDPMMMLDAFRKDAAEFNAYEVESAVQNFFSRENDK